MKFWETVGRGDLVQCLSQLKRAKKVGTVELKGCILMVSNERKEKVEPYVSQ